MERDGLDAPDARPLDRAFFFGGESLAGLACFAVHLRKDGAIEIALIERGFAAADDGGDNARKGFQASHCEDGIGMLAGDTANLERELCGGGERVAASVHWRG